MKTVIYLDELLLVNFVAAAALLLAAGLLAGQACSARRLLLGAGAAACSALVLLVPEQPFALSLLYKFGTGAGIVRLTYGPQGARSFLRLGAWYLLLNLMLTGAVAALAVRTPGAGAQTNNLAVYLELSPGVLLLSVGGIYLALRGVLFVFGRGRAAAVPATLVLSGAEIPVQAFYDTGFSVEDPIGGRTVVLLRYAAVRDRLPPLLREYLDAQFFDSKGEQAVPTPDPSLHVRFVACGTIAGSRLLPAVPAQALRRKAGPRSWQKEGLLAVFCGEDVPDAGWSLLLGPDLAGPMGLEAPL